MRRVRAGEQARPGALRGSDARRRVERESFCLLSCVVFREALSKSMFRVYSVYLPFVRSN